MIMNLLWEEISPSNFKFENNKQTNKQGRSRHQRQCAVIPWLSTANADRWSFSTEMAIGSTIRSLRTVVC
jgi:hypothetical protein